MRSIERMPRTLRHRDRAVTIEDYEDLALLATSEVARALLRAAARSRRRSAWARCVLPGAVSVIVVPRTSDVKPLPTLDLLSRVKDFLAACAPATAVIVVVGPLYVRVDVRADVALSSPQGASAVERAMRDRLADFLHPLTGGLDGKGWDFGRAPHRSDFFALVEAVPGVDHVRYLQIYRDGGPAGRAPDRPFPGVFRRASDRSDVRGHVSEARDTCRCSCPISTTAAMPTWWPRRAG